MSTFIELKDEAEQQTRAHLRSSSSDSTHHFIVDSTNHFVEHGAVLLAALRLWAKPRQKSDADLRTLIDSANAATLEDIAEELAQNRDPDEFHAMPACSSKASLMHLHASYTTHSGSHGRASNRAGRAGRTPRDG